MRRARERARESFKNTTDSKRVTVAQGQLKPACVHVKRALLSMLFSLRAHMACATVHCVHWRRQSAGKSLIEKPTLITTWCVILRSLCLFLFLLLFLFLVMLVVFVVVACVWCTFNCSSSTCTFVRSEALTSQRLQAALSFHIHFCCFSCCFFGCTVVHCCCCCCCWTECQQMMKNVPLERPHVLMY